MGIVMSQQRGWGQNQSSVKVKGKEQVTRWPHFSPSRLSTMCHTAPGVPQWWWHGSHLCYSRSPSTDWPPALVVMSSSWSSLISFLMASSSCSRQSPWRPPISNDHDTVERRTHPGTLLLQQHLQEAAIDWTEVHGPIGRLLLAIIVVKVVCPILDWWIMEGWVFVPRILNWHH